MAGTAYVALVAAAVLALAVTIPAEGAGDVPHAGGTISVTGMASSSVEPDLLVIRFGVEVQEETARGALESNSALMGDVIDSIKSAGVTEGELATSRFSIHPAYGRYDEQTGQSPMVGYRVTNTVTVSTDRLDAAAGIIDGGVAAGANRVDGVSFVLSPERQSQVRDGLIAAAVLDARAKADKALAPLDLDIIGVESIVLLGHGAPPPQHRSYGYEAMAADAKSVSVFSSGQDVTAAASVVFLIG